MIGASLNFDGNLRLSRLPLAVNSISLRIFKSTPRPVADLLCRITSYDLVD